MVEIHKKNMAAMGKSVIEKCPPFDYQKILEGAYQIIARQKKRE